MTSTSNFSVLKNQKILITGGAGFIAYHLTTALLKLGVHVVGIDNFDPFYPKALKEKNLADLRKTQKELGANFEFFEIDFCDSLALNRLPTDFSAVIHLGAKAGVRPSLEDPLGYIRANLHGTTAVLEWMQKSQQRNFIFGSSSSVYGNSSVAPFKESMACDKPISPYAATKRAGELLCATYQHLYGFQIAALRFFTVYGPRQRPDLAIRKFVNAIAQNQKITLFGDGSSARDYTFVMDIVAGILGSLTFVQNHQGPVFEIFNLGNSHPVPLQKMLNTIESAMGVKANIQWEKMQPGDVEITCADVSKAKLHLQYQALTPFEDGIRQVVEWSKTL